MTTLGYENSAGTMAAAGAWDAASVNGKGGTDVMLLGILLREATWLGTE